MVSTARAAQASGAPARARALALPPSVVPQPTAERLPPSSEEIGRRLEPLCRKHGIVRLELFGSVARGEARPGSDVDLIASFREHPGLGMVTIEEAFSEAVGVPVHLLTAETVAAMRNPYRKASIDRDRRCVYGG